MSEAAAEVFERRRFLSGKTGRGHLRGQTARAKRSCCSLVLSELEGQRGFVSGVL